MDDYYTEFKVTDWDIANEFNPNRARRRQTKNEAIYGVWADSDDDNDGDNNGSSKGKATDMSAPISFISSGLKDCNDKKMSADNDINDERIDDTNSKADSTDKSYEETSNRKHSKTTKFAGFRHSSNFEGSEDFGKWESHTKGIGAKLLQKMGYQQGKGLGKHLQGITAPIEAKKRSGSGAVGYYGPEHKHRVMLDDGDELSDVNKAQKKVNSDKRWKKREETIKRAEVVLKSVDDIIAEGLSKRNNDFQANRVKVIDMTGPEQKIFSGYHQIHQKHENISDEINFDSRKESHNLSEIENNIKLLVNVAEEEIIENSRELRRENERYENLEMGNNRLKDVIEEESKQLNNVEKLLETINNMVQEMEENKLTIDNILRDYEQMETKYPSEFKSLKLHDILIPTAFPLIRRILREWKPLENPKCFRDLFEKLRSYTYQSDGIYETLMWHIWMPSVRREILQWNSIRQCDEVITFLESWKPLMPDWLFENIIEQIVLPLMQKEVEEWNPLTDTVPIHSWLHPWLPLMADRSLEHLYAPIRHKLGNALTNWHPSDNSARLILEPWKGVFSDATLEAFINIHITPKLEISMQSLVINPRQQCLDSWHWVMSWQHLLSTHTIASILEKHFFQRWLSVLYNWLSNNANFDEVSEWYSGWKSMISPQLQSHPSIKESLKRALDMMNHVVSSNVGMKSFHSNYSNLNQNTNRAQSNVDVIGVKDTVRPDVSLNFKQLVELKANEMGILFMPIQNRFYEAKQIYKFGKLSIYIDRQVLFVFNINNNNWIPTSLQNLIDSAL